MSVGEVSKLKTEDPHSEAEFVEASQAGQEVVYFSSLLKGFGYTQEDPTAICEDIKVSCIVV